MRPGVLSTLALVCTGLAHAQEAPVTGHPAESAESQEAPTEATALPVAPGQESVDAPPAEDPATTYARRIDASFQGQAKAPVLSCMSRAPGKVQRLGGLLALDLTVQADGSLSSVQLREADSTLTHGKTVACLVQGLSIVVLPRPPQDAAPLSIPYRLDIAPVE